MAGGEKIVINDATSQFDRWLRALEPSYAEVDGRGFVELLEFGVRFGALINFYNSKDRIDGDWVEFFLCNPSMLLASILAIDKNGIEREFRQLRAAADEQRRFESKVERLGEAFALIHRAASQTNLWLRTALADDKAPWANAVRTRILAALKDGLADRLRQIKTASAAARGAEALGRAIELPFEEFDPAWGSDADESEAAFFEGDTPQARASRAWMQLEPAVRDLLHLTGDLQKIARSYFAESLKANNHQPQIGLYMAFCRLFKKAQDTLNTFSQRYIDFYYREVLRDSRAAATADRVYLTFVLAPSEDVFAAPVPAGTLFPAGESADGREILFAADLALSVLATLVERIHTLRVDDAPLWFDAQDPVTAASGHRHRHHHHRHHHHHHHPDPPPPERYSAQAVPALLIASDILLPDAKPAAGEGSGTVVAAEGFATFGQAIPQATSHEIGRYASLGFALSTQTLLLSGGIRTVSVRFQAKQAGTPPPLSERLKLIAEETGTEEVVVFQTVLAGAFDISVFTEKGWLAVESYTANASLDEDTSFTLEFTLSAEFPPLRLPEAAAGEPAAAGQPAGYVPQAPALKAELRQQPVAVDGPKRSVLVYPFALLDAVDVAAIVVDVSANPLPVGVLRNTDGEIDPASPYPFFGGAPEVGSYFEIQQTELFVKSIYNVEVRVDWFDLPQDAQGFAGYYRFYTVGADGKPLVPPISNDSFKADVAVKNPGWWRIENTDTQKPLIEEYVYRSKTGEVGEDGKAVCSPDAPVPDKPLCPQTLFNDLNVKRIAAGAHYDPAGSAIRIQLKAPPYGYGSSIYAQNVLNSVIADLPDAGQCEAKCQADCAVWTNLQTRLQTSLDECAGQTGEEYLECIWPKLVAVILLLLGAYELCKRDCAAKDAGPGEDAAVATLRSLVGAPPGELPSDFRQTVTRLRQQLDSGAGKLSASRRVCGNFIRVALGIFAGLVEAVLAAPDPPIETGLPQQLQPVLASMSQYYSECLDICITQCMQLKGDLKYPSDPYLPQAESVQVSYWADVATPAEADRPSDLKFYHLLPFGGYQQVAVDDAGVALLPRYREPGNLYLGLSPFLRAQDLTLLFQMANSRPGGVADALPPVSWCYLSDDTWIEFKAEQVASDGSNGLQNTGILALRLPAIPGSGTLLPPTQRWLRASVARMPDLFPLTVAVTPNALLATRFQGGDLGAPYVEPVPAGTISGSVQDLGDVATIAQPMPSFGGRPAQDQRDFAIYSGERLRHKDRAVLAWDYERLVLERFPSIWKVKALPAHDGVASRVPGSTLVVVVPGPEFPQVSDPTVPSAPGEVLNQIASYLRERASPFAAILVDNPLYVRVTVKATVTFNGAQAAGDAIGRLNDELVQYLSPWFYDAERAAKGSRYWEEAEISAFIQTRPYVAQLRKLTLTPDRASERLKADWCFVTSAKSHDITDAGWQEKRA
ncbi:MAG: hypothetical protein HY244_12735 [Rhizobiales bacterium]|nr:hypothetical protein [Hyphomicrobiales bacterium]